MTKEILLEQTQGICKVCFKTIDAQVVEKNGRVFLKKKCPVHGEDEVLHKFDIPELYKGVRRIFSDIFEPPNYFRSVMLYVTNQCNMHCPVCFADTDFPEFKEPSLPELEKFLDNYKGKGNTVNLIGGEPTVRQDLAEIIKAIKRRGMIAGFLSNGIKLQDSDYVRKIKNAGADVIALSLDSLRGDDVEYLKGRNILSEKLKAFDNLKKAGIGIYLFCVIAENVNEDQIVPLVNLAKNNIGAVAVISFYPIFRTGRYKDLGSIPISKIYDKMKEIGLTLEDFLATTEMAYLFCKLGNKLFNTKMARYNPCAQEAFLFKGRSGEWVKLSQLLNMEYLIGRLRKINMSTKNESFLKNWITFLTSFPFFYLIRQIVSDKTLRTIFFSVAREFVKKRSIDKAVRTQALNIRICYFFDVVNADLNLLKMCNLPSSAFKDGDILCSCMRQIGCDSQRASLNSRNCSACS